MNLVNLIKIIIYCFVNQMGVSILLLFNYKSQAYIAKHGCSSLRRQIKCCLCEGCEGIKMRTGICPFLGWDNGIYCTGTGTGIRDFRFGNWDLDQR